MEITKSPMWDDVKKVLEQRNKKIRFHYMAEIHTEKKDIMLPLVVEFDLVRDYLNNFADEFLINVRIPQGVYTFDIFPYRDNLEMTIHRETLSDLGGKDNLDIPKEKERFKAVWLQENPKPTSTESNATNQATLDANDFSEVKFQLLNRSLEGLRQKRIGGIIRDKKYEDIIRGVIGGESYKVIVDGKPSIEALDIVKPDNQEIHKHVIIPQNTPLTSLPTYLQERMGGVYNAGIGNYLQTFRKKMFWFIYPPYNYLRFNTDVPKAIIYILPQTRFPSLDVTFRLDPDGKTDYKIIHILSVSAKYYTDDSGNEELDVGVGFKMSDARKYMKPNAEKDGVLIDMTPKGPIQDRLRLNYEMSAKERKDKANIAPDGRRSIGSNPLAEYSELMRRSGGRIDITWINGRIEHLYPGMPVKVIFLDTDKPKELEGSLLYNHTVVSIPSNGLTARSHNVNTLLTIFIKPIKEDYRKPVEVLKKSPLPEKK